MLKGQVWEDFEGNGSTVLQNDVSAGAALRAGLTLPQEKLRTSPQEQRAMGMETNLAETCDVKGPTGAMAGTSIGCSVYVWKDECA